MGRIPAVWAIMLASAVAVLLSAAPAAAGGATLFVGGATPNVKVASLKDQRYLTVTPQRYDYSCGSAALATLLSYHYARPTTEEDAFRAMWAVGDQARIREVGFSLLEMKTYLESIGLAADGFRIDLKRLEEIAVPGIALIDVKGYKHFVVIKGLSLESVLVGDPSKGVKAIPRRAFERMWDGVILFVRSDLQLGKENFNTVRDWRLSPRGPTDRPLDPETLQGFALNQTRSTFSVFTIQSPGVQ